MEFILETSGKNTLHLNCSLLYSTLCKCKNIFLFSVSNCFKIIHTYLTMRIAVANFHKLPRIYLLLILNLWPTNEKIKINVSYLIM